MPFCPSVVRYKVVFADGNVLFQSLPGSANVYAVADQYAKEHSTSVVSIETLY